MPEVDNVISSLESLVLGKTIQFVEITMPKMIKKPSTSDTFKSSLENLPLSHIRRIGKHIIFDTGKNLLIGHLGMTGAIFGVDSLEKINPKFAKHIHIVFTFTDNTYMVFCDIRRFGGMKVMSYDEFKKSPLGKEIDCLSFEDNFEEVWKRVQKKSKSKTKNCENKTIKSLLMDQSVIAGVGNIYASETMYHAKIHPSADFTKLDRDSIYNLFLIAKNIMSISIKYGGTSISDYVNGEGKSGSFQNYLKVYGKKGLLCEKCKSNIEKIEQLGRATFFCPSCQEMENPKIE